MKYELGSHCSLPCLGMAESSQGYHQEETLLDVCGHLFPRIHSCHSSGNRIGTHYDCTIAVLSHTPFIKLLFKMQAQL